MVAAGGFMLMLALAIALLAKMDRIMAFPLLLKALPFLLPLPFLANSAGWFIAEAGRQPWIVVGLQKTADAVSPNLTAGSVWLTMIGFTALYLLLAIAALYIALRHIRTTSIPVEGRDS